MLKYIFHHNSSARFRNRHTHYVPASLDEDILRWAKTRVTSARFSVPQGAEWHQRLGEALAHRRVGAVDLRRHHPVVGAPDEAVGRQLLELLQLT